VGQSEEGQIMTDLEQFVSIAELNEELISEIERENERLKEQNKRQNEAIDSLREMYAKEAKP
jgi:hypothetical protein